MSAALEIRNVSKRFNDFLAVDDLNLTVQTGELLGFLGPNGAGKTTTLRMVMSILFPDRGEIVVLGRGNALEMKDRIGYLPEERGLYRKMTVEGTLRYFGRLKGLRGPHLTRQVEAALDRVQLKAWRRKPVDTLSKGMQQKLQFAATLLHEPELVILDEPFSGLDPINVELLTGIIREMRKRGVTVIFSTHQMEQAQRMCDRIVLINRGRKLLDGAPAEIRRQQSEPLLVIEAEGDLDALARLPGVASMQRAGNQARIELAPEADTHALLKGALQHVRVERFEVQAPELHDIFLRLVERDSVERGLKQPDATLAFAGSGAD